MIRSPYWIFVLALLWALSLLAVFKLYTGEMLARTKAEIRADQLERELKHANTLLAIDPRQP
jgi:uncharacterized membrane protein YhaH (DUF805 family)